MQCLFFSAYIINACCILHNIAIKWNIPPEDIFSEGLDDELLIPNDNINNNAEERRKNIVQWYFTE